MRLPDQYAEVRQKSEAQVERETAKKWAGRAIACFRLYRASGVLDWLTRAHTYRDEALEHAAMVGDHGKTVKAIQNEIDRLMKKPVESKRKRRVSASKRKRGRGHKRRGR